MSEMNAAEIRALARAYLGLVDRPVIPLSIDLWRTAEIAAYLKRSEAVVRDRVVTLAKFPPAIRIPVLGSKGKGQPLWRAEEVIEWAAVYQEKRR